IGPLVIAFVYSFVRQPIFMERVFVASSVFVPILIAIPVARFSKRSIAVAVAIGVLALSTWSSFCFMQANLKEQWKWAVWEIIDRPRDNRLLLFVGNEGEILYDYYVDRLAPHPRKIEAKLGLPQGYYDLDPPRTMRRVLVDADLQLLIDALASGK